MLEQLSKNDQKWRRIALKICGNKQLADDIVNDMYLKIHDLNKTDVNDSYVGYCMYHLFLNHIKKYKKELSFDDTIKILDESTNLKDRSRLNNILNELGLFDREVLLLTSEMSLRKAKDEVGISVKKLFYQKRNALEKLKNNPKIKDWKNER